METEVGYEPIISVVTLNRVLNILSSGDGRNSCGTQYRHLAHCGRVTAATNDVRLVTLPNGQHLAVAVFVSDSKANDVICEKVIARVARATRDEWSK